MILTEIIFKGDTLNISILRAPTLADGQMSDVCWVCEGVSVALIVVLYPAQIKTNAL